MESSEICFPWQIGAHVWHMMLLAASHMRAGKRPNQWGVSFVAGVGYELKRCPGMSLETESEHAGGEIWPSRSFCQLIVLAYRRIMLRKPSQTSSQTLVSVFTAQFHSDSPFLVLIQTYLSAAWPPLSAPHDSHIRNTLRDTRLALTLTSIHPSFSIPSNGGNCFSSILLTASGSS